MIYAVDKETKRHVVAYDNDAEAALKALRPMNIKIDGWRLVQADADGWIEWSGGECPVPDEARVAFKLRNRIKCESPVYTANWGHSGASWDIVAYRPILDGATTQPEVSMEALKEASAVMNPEQYDEPHHIIDELDQARDEMHRAEQLHDMLRAEAVRLYPWLFESTEDMTDPANWQAGDRLIYLADGLDLTAGKTYEIEGFDVDGDVLFVDDNGENRARSPGGFRFHSRPAK